MNKSKLLPDPQRTYKEQQPEPTGIAAHNQNLHFINQCPNVVKRYVYMKNTICDVTDNTKEQVYPNYDHYLYKSLKQKNLC
jgi:hypothetical protein